MTSTSASRLFYRKESNRLSHPGWGPAQTLLNQRSKMKFKSHCLEVIKSLEFNVRFSLNQKRPETRIKNQNRSSAPPHQILHPLRCRRRRRIRNCKRSPNPSWPPHNRTYQPQCKLPRAPTSSEKKRALLVLSLPRADKQRKNCSANFNKDVSVRIKTSRKSWLRSSARTPTGASHTSSKCRRTWA